MNEELWIPVIPKGTWTDGAGKVLQCDGQFLDDLVRNYNEKKEGWRAAPVCLGHPENDKPKFATVETLKNTGNLVMAKLKDVAPEFVDWVKKGYYSWISPSIRADRTLKHIAALGAVPPAIPGMATLQESFGFADTDGDNEYSTLGFNFAELAGAVMNSRFYWIHKAMHNIREFIIENFSKEKADQVIGEFELEELGREFETQENQVEQVSFNENNKQEVEKTTMFNVKSKNPPGNGGDEGTGDVQVVVNPPAATGDMTVQFAEMSNRLTAAEANAAKANSELATLKKEKVENAAATFAEGLVNAGKLFPKFKEKVAQLYIVLQGAAPFNFSEGGQTVQVEPAACFQEIFNGMPMVLPLKSLKEMKQGKGGPVEDTLAAEFSDAEDTDLDQKALAISKEKNISYEAALKIARGGM